MDREEKNLLVSNSLKRNWGWLLALGILFEVLGLVGLGMTVSLTMASMLIFGIFIIIAGVFQIADALRSHRWRADFWHAVIGLLYVIAGGIIIYDPILASAVLTALIAWLLIVIGITRMVMAIILRNMEGWAWLMIAGLMAIILGIIILAHWPISGLWVIGLFIAIELIFNGWSYIILALTIRRS